MLTFYDFFMTFHDLWSPYDTNLQKKLITNSANFSITTVGSFAAMAQFDLRLSELGSQ